MLARTDYQGSGDGEASKDEATRTFSVELLRNKQNEEHPKGQKLLGRVEVCNAIFHEADKKVKRVVKVVKRFKKSPDSLVGEGGRGRRDTQIVVLNWSGGLIRESL